MANFTLRTDVSQKEYDIRASFQRKQIEGIKFLNDQKGKVTSIFAGRNSQFGDIIVYLPFLTYLNKIYSNSYKIYSLAKKCSAIAPLLLNHPFIDRIQITKEKEGWSDQDLKIANTCDFVFDINPPITHPTYFNYRGILEETFLMNINLTTKKRMIFEDYNTLDEQEKLPKLEQWFDTVSHPKTIGLLPFAGYGKSTLALRSPNLEWWEALVPSLAKDYKLLHFGHPSNPVINPELVTNMTTLTIFETVQHLLGCDIILGSDSGLQWVCGAYGHKQIVLYTNYMEEHTQNVSAFLPVNNKNNLISHYSVTKNFTDISIDDIIRSVKILETH